MKKLTYEQKEQIKALRKTWMPKVGGTSVYDEMQIRENASFKPFSYGIDFSRSR